MALKEGTLELLYEFVKYSTLTIVLGSILILSIISFYVKDFDFASKKPSWFVAETLVTGLVGALPVLIIGYSRNESVHAMGIKYVLLALNCGILHVLLNFSGVYARVYRHQHLD